MKIFFALLPIILALGVGYALGKILPSRINIKLIKSISPLVLCMLFLLGFEFGEIIFSAKSLASVLKNAMIFSILTTLIPAVLLLLLKDFQNTKKHEKFSFKTALPALKESFMALGACFLGALLFVLQNNFEFHLALPESADLLLVLILLVGLDLTQIDLDKKYLTYNMILIPFLVVLGSLIGGVLASYVSDESLKISLALSSGFGWFTLSSVLLSDAYGVEYGSMALLTDLFRELIAIVLLYFLGQKRPKLAIGASGATALDSTLPIIKQTCSSNYIPTALFSGFVLTVLAPIFITIFTP